MSLTWMRLRGEIDQAEMARRVDEILNGEPELPLGIGATTEVQK